MKIMQGALLFLCLGLVVNGQSTWTKMPNPFSPGDYRFSPDGKFYAANGCEVYLPNNAFQPVLIWIWDKGNGEKDRKLTEIIASLELFDHIREESTLYKIGNPPRLSERSFETVCKPLIPTAPPEVKKYLEMVH